MPNQNEGQKNEGNATTSSNSEESKQTATSAGSESSSQQTSMSDKGGFTQEQVNQLVGQARVDAREKATSTVLSDLGFTDIDSLKGALKEYNDSKRANLDELERVKLDLDALQGADVKLKEFEKQNKLLLKIIDSQVEKLMTDLKVPEYVKPLIENMPSAEKLAYLTEHSKEFESQTKPKPNINSEGKGSNGSSAATDMSRIKTRYNIR